MSLHIHLSSPEITGVSKHFGRHHVLDDINLAVPAGSVCAIVGPSGSGKSTLLRCINHLERIDAGTIRLGDELLGYQLRRGKLYEMNEREAARQRLRVGMVFQGFNLFPHLTVLGNLIEAPVQIFANPARRPRSGRRPCLRRSGLPRVPKTGPRLFQAGSSSGWRLPVR